VIGDQHSIKSILVEDGKDTQHIDVTIIDKRLVVGGHFAAYVSKVNVCNALLAAVLLDCFVEIALGHLRQGTQAEFQLISWAFRDIDQALIHAWPSALSRIDPGLLSKSDPPGV
jgi:hypothetical protein